MADLQVMAVLLMCASSVPQMSLHWFDFESELKCTLKTPSEDREESSEVPTSRLWGLNMTTFPAQAQKESFLFIYLFI